MNSLAKVTLFLLIGLFVCAGSVLSAEINPILQNAIDLAAEDDMVEGIITMADQVDAPALAEQYNHLGRAEVHRIVVDALRAKADATQAEINAFLATKQASGEVESYQPMWLVNSFIVHAKPAVYQELTTFPQIAALEKWPEMRLIEPVSREEASTRELENVEPNLEQVGAHVLWAMGYTGDGIIVSNTDSGVNRNHPALSDRWRGNMGHPGNECYYPWPASNVTNDHGTHVMGTQCGRDPATADTIGVAPDAQWIAAHTLSGGGSTMLAYQWLADPDGDSNTVDDVPIANNNSWGWVNSSGVGIPCANNGLNSWLNNLEAAQCAVIFAIGNDGPGEGTASSPGDKTFSPTSIFSVGAVNGENYVAGFSSRGPTTCFGEHHIKPEIAAPGVAIRSASYGNSYAVLQGTSMAAPHVAGAFAVLAEARPNATIEDIKQALYLSAIDGGSTIGEDNNYGNGTMWLPGALDLLDVPRGKVEVFVRNGETNQFLPLHPVEILPFGLHPYTMPSGITQAYPVPAGEVYVTATATFGLRPDTLTVEISENQTNQVLLTLHPIEDGTFTGMLATEDGDPVSGTLIFTHVDNPEYVETGSAGDDGLFSIDVMAGTYDLFIEPEAPYIVQNITGVTVEEQGITDLGDLTMTPTKLLIVDDDNGSDYENFYTFSLDELGLPYILAEWQSNPGIIATLQDYDWVIWFTGDATSATLVQADRDALTAYLDAGKHLILSGQYLGEDIGDTEFFTDYLHAEHTTDHVNASLVEGIAGDEVGDEMFFALTGGSGAGNQVSQSGVGAVGDGVVFLKYQNTEEGAAVRTLGSNGYHAIYCGFGIEAVVAPPQFTSREKLLQELLGWQGLVVAVEFADFTATAAPEGIELDWLVGADASNVVGFHVDRRDANGITRLTNDLHVGTHYTDATAQVGQTYDYRVEAIERNGEVSHSNWVTVTYTGSARMATLNQNYPNPFNPVTQIAFSVPVRSIVELAVYNTAGQRISTLVADEIEAGSHEVTWRGTNEAGEPVTSGVYFYQLKTGDETLTRRMVLLK